MIDRVLENSVVGKWLDLLTICHLHGWDGVLVRPEDLPLSLSLGFLTLTSFEELMLPLILTLFLDRGSLSIGGPLCLRTLLLAAGLKGVAESIRNRHSLQSRGI